MALTKSLPSLIASCWSYKMTRFLKSFCAVALVAAIPTGAMAYRVGVPDTYSDLLWRVTTNVPGLIGCTELQVDATGDLRNSSKLSTHQCW